MAKTLNFTLIDGLWVSDAITSENASVTINLISTDGDRHNVAAEHSINGEYWQFCGNTEYNDGVELTVDGLREGVQSVRFITDAEPRKAEWV